MPPQEDNEFVKHIPSKTRESGLSRVELTTPQLQQVFDFINNQQPEFFDTLEFDGIKYELKSRVSVKIILCFLKLAEILYQGWEGVQIEYDDLFRIVHPELEIKMYPTKLTDDVKRTNAILKKSSCPWKIRRQDEVVKPIPHTMDLKDVTFFDLIRREDMSLI